MNRPYGLPRLATFVRLFASVRAREKLVFRLTGPEPVRQGVRFAGHLFYLFVGIFSVTLVAQFGSFVPDLDGGTRGTSFLWIHIVLAFLWTALSIYLVRENRRWRAAAPNRHSAPV